MAHFLPCRSAHQATGKPKKNIIHNTELGGGEESQLLFRRSANYSENTHDTQKESSCGKRKFPEQLARNMLSFYLFVEENLGSDI